MRIRHGKIDDAGRVASGHAPFLKRRDYMNIETIDLAVTDLDVEVANLLGFEYAAKYEALPVRREGQHLWVAMSRSCDKTLADLADLTGLYIMPLIAPAEEIRFHINQLYGVENMHSLASQFLVDEQLKKREDAHDWDILMSISSASAVRLLDSLIEAGVLSRASDIHIEPFGQQLRARLRVDGQLITYATVDLAMLPNILSRLKIMSGLDIAEKRRPQDGHFTMAIAGEKIEFRLSTLPTTLGEKAAIRLLYEQTARLKKDGLGFFDDDLQKLTRLFNRPYGAIFMTGPTGSGKSTTLNCFLEELNSSEQNIVTVEDPVENPILGVNHVNTERAAGLDFANALRHILRQDPDIIMIGEVRDQETALIAIRAAITGHLVLSTVHTNDAAGVIERLVDMGVEPYLAAAAIIGVVSQRLVRRICGDCRVVVQLSNLSAKLLDIPDNAVVYKGQGCARCNNTGYKGRLAVYEYIIMDEDMRRGIGTNPAAFVDKWRENDNLKKNAVRNVLRGNTTADEIIRILGCG